MWRPTRVPARTCGRSRHLITTTEVLRANVAGRNKTLHALYVTLTGLDAIKQNYANLREVLRYALVS